MQERMIAGYHVIRRLGVGGMGEVYLVQHPRLPRRDALKLLDVRVSRNDDFAARFQREADLLAPLSHQNIVHLYDRGLFEGRLWLTMEYVDGEDAAHLLRANGPMPLPLATDIIAGAGAGLDYAYQRHGITHRDVKPANVLVEFHDRRLAAVKLADFGIAKAAGEATSLTSTGVTIGTIAYMSPEAIEGRPLDNRADVYSLGCAAFELLTGTVPFTDDTMTALISAQLTRPAPGITERAPHLPRYLDAVFARVLAKAADDRFPTCAEFIAAMRGVGSAVPAVPTQAMPGPPTQAMPGPPTQVGRPPTQAAPRPPTRLGPPPSAGVSTTGRSTQAMPPPTGAASRPRPTGVAPGAGAQPRPRPAATKHAPPISDGPASHRAAMASGARPSTPPVRSRRRRRTFLVAALATFAVLALVVAATVARGSGFGLGGGGSVVQADSVTLVDFSPSPDSSRRIDNVLTGDSPPWHTATYVSGPDFGHLKAGIGLLFTLDRAVTLTGGDIRSPSAGSTVEVRTASSSDLSSLDGTNVVWSGTLVDGRTEFTAQNAAQTRYVLVWITGLAGSGRDWSTTIARVVIRGR